MWQHQVTLLFPVPGPHNTETKPKSRDVPFLSSPTPNHTPLPLLSTLGNYTNIVWNGYAVTFMIKGTYSQENLISQVIQPNSLDPKLNQVAQTDPVGMQDFWLVKSSFGKSTQGGILARPIIIQKVPPLSFCISSRESFLFSLLVFIGFSIGSIHCKKG